MTDATADTTAETPSPAIAGVLAALQANDIPKAVGLARAALDQGDVHPLLLNLRAYWFEDQGKLAEALADLEKARTLAPDDVPVLNALGLCLSKLERWDDAIAAFDAVIARDKGFAPAHYNRGWNSEFRGDLEQAGKSYRDALALNPRYAEPLSRLAGLAARRGDWEEADRLATQALALDDRQFYALQSQMRVAIGQKDYPRADALIAKHLADDRARPLDQALTYAYLGDLRNAQGLYADAFKAYSEGNKARVEIFTPRFREPGVQSAVDYVNWLGDYLARAPAAMLAADRQAAPPPEPGDPLGHVFLIGSPRSGTTLLENVLISHPAIVSLEERPALKDAIGEFLTSEWGLKRLSAPMRRDLVKFRKLYWDKIRRERVEPAGKVFVDKNPLYLVNLPVVAKMFPNAKVIFALRDPRDVVLSCYRHVFQMNRSMFEYLTLEGAARFYDALMRYSMTCREKLGLDWHELRNESLVEDFEAEARKVCAFLGVEWSAEMSDFAEKSKKRFIATPSATQVMRGISREGVGQWRRYKNELAPVLAILKPWVERFGYEPD